MTYWSAMKVVPAVVRYGSASATSLTANGTPSSSERGLPCCNLRVRVRVWVCVRVRVRRGRA